ncbi:MULTISPECIES: HIRAN domain-containing protein [Rothia]|uniref:Uncharacterized protein n=1 Tax=Rothia nasimurium TaxID=85336 RepID=A0A1Y1RQE1_9MICC|nr:MULTISPECIES: HIRAN domain-containing protein [Rothia]ORC21959.1 hypothetical protein A7979_00065 [Rothia nasimurium]
MTDYVLGDRGTVQVITDDFYDAEILHIFEELLIDRERVWHGMARLIPEPDNPYQPNAIAVYVDSLKVGRLSAEDSATYWNPITRVVASGHSPLARLQLTAVLRGVTGATHIESGGLLSLSAPGSLFPLNAVPPQAALLPQGASMKVLDEKDHSEYLHSILPSSGEGRMILSLENNQIMHADGRVVESVDVLHDRKVIGRLSTQISEQLAPVIRYVSERDKVASAWGTIRGNAYELSVTVQAERTAEIPAAWFDELPNYLPELVPPASSYDVPAAYRATEGETFRATSSKKKRSLAPSSSHVPAETAGAVEQSAAEGLKPRPSASLGLQRVSVLLGLMGGLVLIVGLVVIFFEPLLGILGVVLGGSIAFMALFFGRDNSYTAEEVSADPLEH